MSEKKKYQITDGKPMTQTFLNRYFMNFPTEFLLRLEKIHAKHNAILEKAGLKGSRFVDMAYDYYQRYQRIYNLATITPVDKKSIKSIEGFLNETISKIKKMYKKQQLTGNTHELVSIIESTEIKKGPDSDHR